MAKKSFDFLSLELTEEKVKEISQDYVSKIIVKNYYTKEILFDSSLNVHFVKFMKAYLKAGEIEKSEYWVKENLGREANGWEHMCQKLYKKHNKYENQLHLVVDLYVKKKGLFTTDRNPKYGFWKQFMWGFLGLEFLDSTFPQKQGGRNFLGRFFASLVMMKFFENQNRKAIDEEYKFNDI